MVWNVTKGSITTRMAVVEERTWSPPSTRVPQPPAPEDRKPWEEKLNTSLQFSEFTKGGFWDVDDVLKPIFKETGEEYGKEFPYPSEDAKK